MDSKESDYPRILELIDDHCNSLILEKNSEKLIDCPQVAQLACDRARSNLGLWGIILIPSSHSLLW